jgi:hypothetical protein
LTKSHEPNSPGFSIELSAIPLDGRLVVLPPDGNEDNRTK